MRYMIRRFLGVRSAENGEADAGFRLAKWQDMTRSVVTSGGRRSVNLNLSTQEPNMG